MTYLLIHGKMSKVHLTVKYSGYSARKKIFYRSGGYPEWKLLETPASRLHARVDVRKRRFSNPMVS